MPYVITTTDPQHVCLSTPERCGVEPIVSRRAVATLDERAFLHIADLAAAATPDTGEGGAWHRRTDAVREMRRDLDLLDVGDLSEWQQGITVDEARAACCTDLARWISEWTGWTPSESGGTVTLRDGIVIEVAPTSWTFLGGEVDVAGTPAAYNAAQT